MTMFYLMMIGGQIYLGPVPEEACKAAALAAERSGLVCRQALSLTQCPMMGNPAVYTVCPIFGPWPTVTLK